MIRLLGHLSRAIASYGLQLLAFISRVLNWLAGGEWPQTLCARIAERFGAECLFCRLVGFVLWNQDHCREDLDDWLRRE